MQRIPCDERADWRETADKVGFEFHTIDGERYWDERAYYAFTLNEIERDLEAATGELDRMCGAEPLTPRPPSSPTASATASSCRPPARWRWSNWGTGFPTAFTATGSARRDLN